MNPLKRLIKKVITTDFAHKYIAKAYLAKYHGSRQYWEDRYRSGGTSGAGSYGRLAEFKANTLENFIDKHNVESVIEFGCGDGNQLLMTEFPQYIGLDVSPTAIQICKEKFESDETKSFFLYDSTAFVDNHDIFESELGLSLDVIYHLTDDRIFQNYMSHLFSSSQKYIIIYSSNFSEEYEGGHIKHRAVTKWVENNAKKWEHTQTIDNKYPKDMSRPNETSWADFYIFEKSKL